MPIVIDRTKRAVDPFRLALATQRQGEVNYHPYTQPSLSGLHGVGLAGLGDAGQDVQTVQNIFQSIQNGSLHLLANQWVTSVQNPFGTALAAIVDEKDASIRNGTATRASVTAALNGVVNLWAQYKVTATAFAAKGSGYATIINQSYATLTPLITQIEADMRSQIAALPGGWMDWIPGSTNPPGGTTTSGPSSYIPILLGVAAIWWISKKKVF